MAQGDYLGEPGPAASLENLLERVLTFEPAQPSGAPQSETLA
jgi:hypothetical protein